MSPYVNEIIYIPAKSAPIGVPMLKIRRWSEDRLIINMGISILVRRYLFIETVPCFLLKAINLNICQTITDCKAEISNHTDVYTPKSWQTKTLTKPLVFNVLVAGDLIFRSFDKLLHLSSGGGKPSPIWIMNATQGLISDRLIGNIESNTLCLLIYHHHIYEYNIVPLIYNVVAAGSSGRPRHSSYISHVQVKSN